MKLIMTILARNEEDIIKENIDFHLSNGVDYIIATDNLSTDRTSEILLDYRERGLLHYINEDSDNYSQHEWVTRMARMAYEKYEADWVINSDADEFWWPVSGDLKRTFSAIKNVFGSVTVKRFNYVAVEPYGQFFERMIYRETCSLNHLGKPLPPKIAHRGSPKIKVSQGNHTVQGLWRPTFQYDKIEILHFPIRSYDQFLNKIKLGGAAYDRNSQLNKTIGVTWRKLYQEYQTKHNLSEFFQDNFYTEKRIREEIARGDLVRDTRLKKYLLELYTHRS